MILSTSIHHCLLSSLLLFYFVDVQCNYTSVVEPTIAQVIPQATTVHLINSAFTTSSDTGKVDIGQNAPSVTNMTQSEKDDIEETIANASSDPK